MDGGWDEWVGGVDRRVGVLLPIAAIIISYNNNETLYYLQLSTVIKPLALWCLCDVLPPPPSPSMASNMAVFPGCVTE